MTKAISIIQQIDHRVISIFKAYYLRWTFGQAIEATVGDHAISLAEFWRTYDIEHATENIQASWQKVTASNMCVVWQKILHLLCK